MKVSILGAGPAGSTAAYYLAREGIDVELIDKTNFPRDKPCGGGLFNPLSFFKEFPYLESFEGKYVHHAKFYCGKYSAEYTSEKPLLLTALRRDFDFFLFKRAVDAGAKFSINKAIEGDIIIDATGARFVKRYPEVGICLVYDFQTDKDIDTAHVYVGFEGIKGYCWLFPKNGHVNIGVGAYMPQKNIRSIYEHFIDFLLKTGIVTAADYTYSATIIPFATIDRFYTANSLLLGDAAGFVKPGSGEGIYFAMLSGKIAAQTIIEKRELSWYEQRCRSVFGEYLKPMIFNWSRFLFLKTNEKAVKICSRDGIFARMFAENFFRLGKYKFAGRFLRNIFT